MDVAHPIRTVVPSAHGPVLTVLARSGQPLTGRAVSELTLPRVSQKRVAEILDSLVRTGLVDVTPAGSSNLYGLNREHLAAEPLALLVTMRDRLWGRLAAHVAGWANQPEVVVVYGSSARGDGDESSDIDLLVVRRDDVTEDDDVWQSDLTDLARKIGRWTGNPVELVERSRSDLARMADDGERLLSEIRRDGRFIVGGRQDVPAPQEPR